MFDFFRKKKQPKPAKEDPVSRPSIGIYDLMNADLETIWTIVDKNEFLIAMSARLDRKSVSGENLDALSEPEKNFYYIYQLEAEVNNGGFLQFIMNSSGNFAHETPDALRAVGADRMAEICDQAIRSVGIALPKDRNARLAALDQVMTPEIESNLDHYDSEFYAYPDPLLELNYQYILRFKDQFS